MTETAAGIPRRALAQALWASLACALAFTAFACVATQNKLVRQGGPWRHDPYDLVVSLTIFLVPALAALIVARGRLPSRDGRRPAGDWLDDPSGGGVTGVVRRHIRAIAAPGPGPSRRAPRTAVTAGALAMPVAAALRDEIWPVLGDGGQVETAPQLAAITATGAVAGALVALAGSSAFGARPAGVRGVLRVLAALVVAVVTLGGAYVTLVAVRHTQPVALPTPTGPHRVGRTAFEWTDHTRTDPLAPRPGGARQLSVWLWYPATPQAAGRPAPYAPGAWKYLHPDGLFGLGETSFDVIRTHAQERVPVAAGRFPVVVLEPGLGLAAPQYTALAENLASNGYLVAGVTPTYSAGVTVLHGRPVRDTEAGNPHAFDSADPAAAARAGASLVAVWAADARFAAAQVIGLGRAGPFAGHVDPARTAYLGHSLGGAAALEACRLDPRCAGAADLDGAPFGAREPNRPIMIIGSENSCVTGACHPDDPMGRAERDMARRLLAAGTAPVWCYEIGGTQHFNFSDYAAYYLAAPIRSLVPLGGIDGGLGLAITNAYLTAFLDHTVRGADEPLLTGATSPYPQVRALHVGDTPAGRR
ncbi:hypothetical protein ABT294_49885 [Nonomuraea sp. NPDC000554]|uniref:hypothetical protein n=1 Tax=Nonomuraea sp. NPDC000554 TaxID=3154259 RepID=UPI00331E2AD9